MHDLKQHHSAIGSGNSRNLKVNCVNKPACRKPQAGSLHRKELFFFCGFRFVFHGLFFCGFKLGIQKSFFCWGGFRLHGGFSLF